MKRYEFSVVTSTMDKAKEIEKEVEANSSAIIIANEQTAGRGQKNRKWENSGEGIYLTIISKFSTNINLNGFSLFIGIVLNKVFNSLEIKTYLKWPNDILDYRGRKLAGVLIETFTKNEQIVLTGIGINIKNPPNIEGNLSASSIGEISNKKNIQDDIIDRIINIYGKEILRFKKNGFSKFQSSWNEFNFFKNKNVEFEIEDLILKGTCLGADSIGRIVLEISGKQQSFINGRLKINCNSQTKLN